VKGRYIHTLLLALVPALFSCIRQEEPVVVPQRYEYRLALEDDGTKALLNQGGVFWQNGDQVGLFLGDGTSVAASVDATTSPKTIVFSTSQALADGTQVRAYYPYVSGNTAASAARINFPAAQSGGAQSAMPLAGVPFQIDGNGTKGVVHFLNLGSVLDFMVYSSTYAGEAVQSITFSVTGGDHPISGEALLDLTGVKAGKEASLALGWSASAPSSVTLTQAGTVASGKNAATGHMYMVVPPGTYSGTISVKTNEATYSLPFQNLTFVRNEFRPVYVNLDGEHASRHAVYSLENDIVTQYLNDVDRSPYSPDNYSVTHMQKAYYSGNKSTTNRLDWPRPVPVRWTNPSSGNGAKVVYVYNDAAMTDLELSVNVSDASATRADVYNLIPGRVYYYVVKNGAAELSHGSFETTGRRRMLKVGDSRYGMGYANNCRDFGGQKTTSGRTIKYGKIFRGSNMDLTSDEQKECLLNYMKVGLDVDLRTNNTSDGAGAGTNHLYDALGLGEMHTTQEYDSWEELTTVASMNATLTKILDAVAAGKVPYIHCKVGADRTGYVCMILEALLGVPQGACDVDYELTSLSGAVDNGVPRLRNGGTNYYYLSIKNYKGEITSVRGVDFINTFSGNTFQEKAIDYVVNTLGIPQEKISAFQNNMLE